MNDEFNKLRLAVAKTKSVPLFKGKLLSLDPGETIGWALWETFDEGQWVELNQCGQIAGWPLIPNGVSGFTGLINFLKPTSVVFESYRVYDWKTDSHSWSNVPTLQIIGAIETLVFQYGLPQPGQQSAQIAKHFSTDEKLHQWGLYKPGQKHARDAIRHGCYKLIFG